MLEGKDGERRRKAEMIRDNGRRGGRKGGLVECRAFGDRYVSEKVNSRVRFETKFKCMHRSDNGVCTFSTRRRP